VKAAAQGECPKSSANLSTACDFVNGKAGSRVALQAGYQANDFYPKTLSRWARGDISAKGQQIADIADRLDATAGAAREDRAIAKDVAEQRLVDIDVLDLVAVHLDRVPGKAGRICR
jgi:hypothetical protein